LCIISISATTPLDINHKTAPYPYFSDVKIASQLIKCLDNIKPHLHNISETNPSDINHLFIKTTDKKDKKKKEYQKSIKKELFRTAFLHKTHLINKVNLSKTPCFLSHIHFATMDSCADIGCKNKFI